MSDRASGIEPYVVQDPIYGAVNVGSLEWQLLSSRPLQRLRGIKQLGLVDCVYPGACHTRFEHSVGTMHMAGKMASHLGLPSDDVRRIRIAGLLHDLGHSAFSHAVEGVLERNPDFQPKLAGKRASRHEAFTREILLSHPFDNRALSGVEEAFGDIESFFREISEIISGGRLPLGQVISGDLDADRIDFLLRDSHHCGVSLGLVDVDQILQSLSLRHNRVVLAGQSDYRAEMSQTAAESILIARAHHYNALVHHPRVQSARAMLLSALESSLKSLKLEEARETVSLFFYEFTDLELLDFIRKRGDPRAVQLLERIKYGCEYPLAARFGHRLLPPGTRIALSTISRSGSMKKLFEDGLGKKHQALVDISTGSGVPRSMRTEEDGFLYDESALAAGLVKSLTRQVTISFFSDSRVEVSLDEVRDQAYRLLSFVREERYLPIDGLLLLFYSIHNLLCETFSERILVPRIRNITWLYRTVARLNQEDGLQGLYDYPFHSDYGFPYSERLFEDIQILVATGMVYQDLRHYEKDGKWLQRYEYMLTSEGLRYAGQVSESYAAEAGVLQRFLELERKVIPYDLVSLLLRRYMSP
ncbi:MAG: HD domain-containing protein [Methanotrichaceae archaeon]|nr:HD domain-containing protein [Methanotrichaceae archaeon]